MPIVVAMGLIRGRQQGDANRIELITDHAAFFAAANLWFFWLTYCFQMILSAFVAILFRAHHPVEFDDACPQFQSWRASESFVLHVRCEINEPAGSGRLT
jgi:hypothetical protein